MTKIAEAIYSDAEYQQGKLYRNESDERFKSALINVGYGFARNKHNLQDVIKVAESKKRVYAIWEKYGVITKEELDVRVVICDLVIKSTLHTINNIL